jgi:hypothetical protein
MDCTSQNRFHAIALRSSSIVALTITNGLWYYPVR